jgi:hypothetical protein
MGYLIVLCDLLVEALVSIMLGSLAVNGVQLSESISDQTY